MTLTSLRRKSTGNEIPFIAGSDGHYSLELPPWMQWPEIARSMLAMVGANVGGLGNPQSRRDHMHMRQLFAAGHRSGPLMKTLNGEVWVLPNCPNLLVQISSSDH
jgi:hypothetical protein